MEGIEQPGTATAAVAEPAAQRTVVVTGAAGFVGTHVCRALAAQGWTVRVVARKAQRAAQRLAGIPVQYVIGDLRKPATRHDALRGADAVVHLAAIAIERHGETYEEVNTDVTRALLDDARSAGVPRFVHMSQNGASSASPHRFLRSKGVAEDAVVASSLDWTVLRPSVIFGRGDEFVTVLARLVRLSPLVYPVPGGGVARFQPVSVRDVAAAVAGVLDRVESVGQTYPLGGPEVLTLRQMVERVLRAMRTGRVLMPVPVVLLRPAIAVLQRLLPRPPVTTELLGLLAVDNTVDDVTLWHQLGIAPAAFGGVELEYLRGITIRDAWRSLW